MSTYIMHHGIRGQKWGVRRFQNEDGSWKEGKGEAHRRAAMERFEGIKNKLSSFGRKAASKTSEVASTASKKAGEHISTDNKQKFNSLKDRAAERQAKRDAKAGIQRDKAFSKNWHNTNVATKKRFSNTDRGINATKEHRIAHGKALADKGETTASRLLKRLGTGIVRDAGILGARAALGVAGLEAADRGHGAIATGAAQAANILGYVGMYYSTKNLIGAYQDVKDMREYRNSKRR